MTYALVACYALVSVVAWKHAVRLMFSPDAWRRRPPDRLEVIVNCATCLVPAVLWPVFAVYLLARAQGEHDGRGLLRAVAGKSIQRRTSAQRIAELERELEIS